MQGIINLLRRNKSEDKEKLITDKLLKRLSKAASNEYCDYVDCAQDGMHKSAYSASREYYILRRAITLLEKKRQGEVISKNEREDVLGGLRILKRNLGERRKQTKMREAYRSSGRRQGRDGAVY